MQTVDALNLALLVAESDSAFGAYVSYLNAVGVPWVIICDGPVLSPGYRKKSLLHQLREAGVALDSPPDFDAPLTDWKAFWRAQGVFTVADRFGGVTDENDKSSVTRGHSKQFLTRSERAWSGSVVQERCGLAPIARMTESSRPLSGGRLCPLRRFGLDCPNIRG